MPNSKSLIAGLILFTSTWGFSADRKDYEANRDVLVIISYVSGLSKYYSDYAKATTDETKTLWATAENTCLFHIWLMYLGPWKFDIHDNPVALKQIRQLPGGFAKLALKAPLVSDPLEILPSLAKGTPIEKCLPRIGIWPNLDTTTIHTKEDYTDLVASYNAWLETAGNLKPRSTPAP